MSSDFSRKHLLSIILIVSIASASILTSLFFIGTSQNTTLKTGDVYTGVAFCGNKTEEAKLLIDRVKNFTNLLVLQSGPISWNETATNEICDYAVEAGLKLIVYFGDLDPRILGQDRSWRIEWVKSARQRLNNSLLGVYYYDEPGGLYIDTDWSQFPRAFSSNSTYDSAAARYVRLIQRDPGIVLLKNSSIPAFVSDYALYWFDYLGGYDVVLAQVGWNHSLPQDIGLLRGAAKMQNKEWGVMITWKYTEKPYLADAEEIFQQMVESYLAGAKYITIFNYPQLNGSSYGVMTEQHFNVLERFWNKVVKNPVITRGSVKAEAVLVLPRNYAWGMRNPEDRIWGYWGPDEKSPGIWNLSRRLIAQYGFSLDIVYDDPNYLIKNNYTHIYYWNQTL